MSMASPTTFQDYAIFLDDIQAHLYELCDMAENTPGAGEVAGLCGATDTVLKLLSNAVARQARIEDEENRVQSDKERREEQKEALAQL